MSTAADTDTINKINESVKKMFQELKRRRVVAWNEEFCKNCENVMYVTKTGVVYQEMIRCTPSKYCTECYNEHCVCDNIYN